MQNNSYHLVYLPLFEEDLNKTVSYIKDTLNNPEAAYRLVDGIEQAILKDWIFQQLLKNTIQMLGEKIRIIEYIFRIILSIMLLLEM